MQKDFMTNYYLFLKQVINGNANHLRDEDYWEYVVDKADQLYKSHRDKKHKLFMLALLSELNRRDKAEQNGEQVPKEVFAAGTMFFELFRQLGKLYNGAKEAEIIQFEAMFPCAFAKDVAAALRA